MDGGVKAMTAGEAMDEPVEMAEAPEETGPQRTCIVTRAVRDKSAMIRFVADPQGSIVPDFKGDLPGRGYWVTADARVLAEGLKRQVFAKVSRGKARATADLVTRMGPLLERQILDQLGLAKKSGHLVAGFEKVEAALRAGQVKLLIEASDGAVDGRAKLARLAGSGVEIWAPLPSAALAPALGREHAVHVAVKPGGMADRLAVTLRRHAGFQPDPATGATTAD
ncbi:MAG: RNA-binding protein [Rhodospirillaceae bacterium]|nr:RNA-binding protein [Rhodospirillaceae bacterium]